MNKEQLAIAIVYAQDKDLDLTPEYWEKKISTLLKRQRQEIIEIVKLKSDIRKAKPADKLGRGYDMGYDDKTDEIIKTLTKQ